jgi:hypothetical protein
VLGKRLGIKLFNIVGIELAEIIEKVVEGGGFLKRSEELPEPSISLQLPELIVWLDVEQ